MPAMLPLCVITLLFVASTAFSISDDWVGKYYEKLAREQRRSTCLLPKALMGRWAYTYPMIPEVQFKKNTMTIDLSLGPDMGPAIQADLECTWSTGKTFLFTGNVMGYDLSMCLKVTPTAKGFEVTRQNRGDIGPFMCCGKEMDPSKACSGEKPVLSDYLFRP